MKKFCLLSLLAICAFATFANATEIPAGNVSGDWYATGNPYNINGEITVPTGSTLNIHEGVQVIFQEHYKFIVDTNATLLALGTIQDTILFTAANPATGWFVIRFFNASDSSKLQFCHLEYGLANGPPDPELSNAGGAVLCVYSSPTIQNSLINNCGANEFGGGICLVKSNPIIINCIIRDNHVLLSMVANYGGGICCVDTSNAVIVNN